MRAGAFAFTTIDELKSAAQRLGAELPLSDDGAVLARALSVQGHVLPNRLAIQPMEGCDGTAAGAPGELTRRRYQRFAQSGAGLIWVEATAILPEGRANPRQLMLTEETLDAFRAMVEEIRETALRATGQVPLIVLQATHSGRYAKPEGVPAPYIAYHNPLYERAQPIRDDRLVTDDYLRRLAPAYARTARLAERAGFDGVDIKACHRYLVSELLSAYTRPGPYGGSYENRTRLLREAVAAARAAVSGPMLVTTRLNVYDGFPYPYGWGVGTDGSLAPVLDEPLRLIGELHTQDGMSMLNVTVGNPYVNPHVNRPYDGGPYAPPESPLTGVARIMACTREVKARFPSLCVVGSGYSYLRQFSPQLAAGMVAGGGVDVAGFGRMAFAYPAFASAALRGETLDPRRCCIACGKCSELMRAGSTAGCVVRDAAVYGPLYRRDVCGAGLSADPEGSGGI